jgi:hypothetical protein
MVDTSSPDLARTLHVISRCALDMLVSTLPRLTIMRVGSHMLYKARAQGSEPELLARPRLFLGQGPLPVRPGIAGPEHY